MKIIDVCNKYSGAGCLKKYYEDNNISDYKIESLMLDLAMGDLNNHIEFLHNVYYFDGFFPDYEEVIDEFINSIDNNTIVRVWSSMGNSDDYLLLLYICNLLKDKCPIHVVFTTDYDNRILSINPLDSRDIPLILEKEKTLTMDEINKYSDEWINQLRINSEVRVMENGVIVNKNYSDYDDIILSTLGELGKCNLGKLVGRLASTFLINDISCEFYIYLINRLIGQGKIKLIETGDRPLQNIIGI